MSCYLDRHRVGNQARSTSASSQHERMLTSDEVRDVVTPLHRQLMLMLLDDTETTMLLLEMLDDTGIRRVEGWQQELLSEQEVIRALIELEGLGLVTRREDSIRPHDLVVSIPEFRLGRSAVVWWALTNAGRSLILQEVAGGTTSPP